MASFGRILHTNGGTKVQFLMDTPPSTSNYGNVTFTKGNELMEGKLKVRGAYWEFAKGMSKKIWKETASPTTPSL